MQNKIIKDAIFHLSNDKKIKKLIQEYQKPQFSKPLDSFNSLAKSIIFQQLSGKSASSIHNRFLSLFTNQVPNPESTLLLNIEDLRKVGLSNQKTNYILELAAYFISKKNNIKFEQLSDDDISKELISIKGIGQWTIDMFLMFTLFRTDILPVADLGVQKGFKKIFNLTDKPDKVFMTEMSQSWRPYRTIACCYLWRCVDDQNFW